MTDASSFLSILLDPLSDTPLVLADVGARGGPAEHWRPLFDRLWWIAFEPDARSREALAASASLPHRHLMLPAALGDHAGDATPYLTRDEGDSSLLRPNTEFLGRFRRPERFDVVGTAGVRTAQLDDELSAQGIRRIDFLKLDTQGSELQILRGARRTLEAAVLGVDVEVELVRCARDRRSLPISTRC
jgi:FkbM family methyltransferase